MSLKWEFRKFINKYYRSDFFRFRSDLDPSAQHLDPTAQQYLQSQYKEAFDGYFVTNPDPQPKHSIKRLGS